MYPVGAVQACGVAIIAAGLMESYLIYAAVRQGKRQIALLMVFGTAGTILLGVFVLVLAAVRG